MADDFRLAGDRPGVSDACLTICPGKDEIRLVYKWARDQSWRHDVIASDGRAMYWRSPNEDQFPEFEIMLDGRAVTFGVNRLDPRVWRDRNYPGFEDGRQYEIVSQGNGIRIVHRESGLHS